jgi:uncharacterized membrane protein
MNSPDPVTTPTVGAIPWFKSPVQIAQVTSLLSAAIALFPKLGTWLGIKTPDDVTTLVQTTFGFIALVAPIVGTIMRARSTIQPLTLTQTAADNHPSTIKAEATASAVHTDPVSPSTTPTSKPWGK